MDKATCAAILCAYEVNRGNGGVESGAREGGGVGAKAPLGPFVCGARARSLCS
jgi:hypothetical protein